MNGPSETLFPSRRPTVVSLEDEIQFHTLYKPAETGYFQESQTISTRTQRGFARMLLTGDPAIGQWRLGEDEKTGRREKESDSHWSSRFLLFPSSRFLPFAQSSFQSNPKRASS